MSHIDDLIQELCPEGVPFQELQDVAKIRNGKDHKSFPAGPIPVFGTGGVMTSIDRAAYEGPSVLIPRKGSLNQLYFVEEPFWTVDTIFYTEINETQVRPKFFYYYLKTQRLEELNQAGGIPSLTQKVLNRLRVPVPPLEVQDEIVRILDTFSALTADLEAELEARRAQYEHYRDVVLRDAQREGTRVPIGDLGRVVTGRTPKSSEAAFWGSAVDFITPSDIKNGARVIRSPARRLSEQGAKKLAKALLPAGSLLVTCIGADMGKTVINANECITNQQINALIPNTSLVRNDYLFHVLTAMRGQLRKQGERSGGTMPLINKTDFSKIQVWVPALEAQERAAKHLDSFDGLVNNLSSGLPAEIEARRKQYEYYRDRLLRFEEVSA